MIQKGYIDTCLLAAYYCPESLTDKTVKVLETIVTPIISLLTEVELLSVMSKKWRKRELSKRSIQQIISLYQSHLQDDYYQKITLKLEHYVYARDLLGSLDYSLHSLDALHLAISASENLTLITADKNLAKICKKIKMAYYLVE